MPAVRMTVVDAADNRPIAGALVLFQATAREGTMTGHGGRSASLFAVETVTDDAGQIRIAAQQFSTQPFFLNTNYETPSLVVLKPGYKLLSLHNHAPTDWRAPSVWDHNDQTVKLSRTTRDAEVAETIASAGTYAEQTVSFKDPCGWKRIPRFLVAVDRAAAEWNGRRESLADEALRRRTVPSVLQRILTNDAFFAEKGCGSARDFFAPYLR
jgi:hypothetical protein